MKTSITIRTAAVALAAIVAADAPFAAESQADAPHRIHRVYPPLVQASAASEAGGGQVAANGSGRAMRAAPATGAASRNGGGHHH